jgi:Flp pilus assembly protein TadG
MRKLDKQRGNAAIEFALSSLLMTTICFAVFQFGYSMYIYNRLTSSVRAAARYAAVASYTSSTSTPTAAYSTAVKNVAVYGSPTTSSGTALVPGLAPANIDIAVTMSGGVARQVTVKVVNYSVNVVFATIRFTGKPLVAFAYNG